MTTDEALAWMFERKSKREEMFMHAETIRTLEFDPGGKPYMMPAGTKVIVTVASRMGDVCLRCTDVDKLEHGYDLRVDPDDLVNYRPALAGDPTKEEAKT